MGKSMKIYVSEYNKKNAPFTNYLGQQVNFINVLNVSDETRADEVLSAFDANPKPPKKLGYSTNDIEDKAACLLNYKSEKTATREYQAEQGFSPMRSSNDTSVSSVFKQEITQTGTDENGKPIYESLTRLMPVDTEITNFKFRDFNVSNNRTYRYTLYPFDKMTDEVLTKLQKATVEPIITSWQGWSITELHPVDSTNKKFTATPDDVWVFNLNVDTGEQSQNISRQEQQTLGQFNRYSQGRMNYVTGSVSCLLGSEVLPASYILKNGKTVNEGGYQEIRKNDKTPSSNQRVDMLLAWRKVVMSSNPKLLKDREGQSFLVTLSSATNKPMDAVHRQPNTISFTWTQIGSTEDVQIVDINV